MPNLTPVASLIPQLPITRSIPLGEATAYAQNYAQSLRDQLYKVFVVAQEQKILVDAWLPEQVGLDVSASYEAPFAQGLASVAPASIGNLAKFLGLSLTTQAFTIQVWQGGTYVEFVLTLVFQAERGGALDVMKPIKDLLKLTMPKDPYDGGLLEAPGPRLSLEKLKNNGLENVTNVAGSSAKVLLGATTALFGDTGQKMVQLKKDAGEAARPVSRAIFNSVENNISLYVGQFLYLPSVVITDVSPTFDVIIGADKNPMKASVNVTFRTFYTLTDKDIEIIFPAATDAELGRLSGTGGETDRLYG